MQKSRAKIIFLLKGHTEVHGTHEKIVGRLKVAGMIAKLVLPLGAM